MNLMNKIQAHARAFRFAAAEKGAVAMEFALSLPILILLLLGGADAAYMMIVTQRVDRIAYSVTDIVTQSEMVTNTDISNILLAASQLMQPFTFGEDGVVILSSIYKAPGQATKISWQRAGGGSLPRTSKIGAQGAVPVMPAGLTLQDNENVVIAEVYYDFRPMFMNVGILSRGDVYRVAIYKPRLSPLITPPT